jgi:hypothetical protein
VWLSISSLVNSFISVRKSHFERVPGHPTNGLSWAFLQTEAWRIFEETGTDDSPHLYSFVRLVSFKESGRGAWKGSLETAEQ